MEEETIEDVRETEKTNEEEAAVNIQESPFYAPSVANNLNLLNKLKQTIFPLLSKIRAPHNPIVNLNHSKKMILTIVIIILIKSSMRSLSL